VHANKDCKVDILLTGSGSTLNLPWIPPEKIEYINYLPVAPFSLLLLLKLQGWEDHRHSSRGDFQWKSRTDATDIDQMLMLMTENGYTLADVNGWVEEDFLTKSEQRVRAFVKTFAWSRDDWRTFGYTVDELVSHVTASNSA
jgi:hypothetical protein